MKAKFITFDLDIPAIIRSYAERFELFRDHETVDSYSEQVALDLKIPEAKQWVKKEIQKQSRTATV